MRVNINKFKIMIMSLAMIFATASFVYACSNYSGESFRNNLEFDEQVRLIMDEDKSLTFNEARERAMAFEKTDIENKEYVPGHFRENLDKKEKAQLVLDENKYLAAHEVVGLGYTEAGGLNCETHIPGSMRANLSDIEKERLMLEELK